MRKKGLIVLLTSALLSVMNPPAFGVQGGESALGSPYVVPINTQTSPTLYGSCSGAVITSRVIATAGHCVLDTSGLISKQILVGQPGSLNKPSSSWAKVSKVLVDDTYQGNTSNGNIGFSDIALLVLEKPIGSVAKVELASDAVFTALKNSGSKIRFIGYGFITDSGARTEEPKFLDANFTSLVAADPNASLISSTNGSACGGDSGAPILSITPTKVTLVGVLTGGNLASSCARKELNGSYLAFITNLSRFTNLVATAIADSGAALESERVSANESIQQEKDSLQLELEATVQELNETRERFTKEINDLVSAINKAGLKVLKCKNQSSTRTIVGKSTICPKGFKKV